MKTYTLKDFGSQKLTEVEKQKTRWQKINNILNISLLALYTQATDLNNKDGEWSIFKEWRNNLEHSHLNLLSQMN